MTRYGPDGKSYAENETVPAIFPNSDFPFGGKTYKKFNAALDAFGALPRKKIEAYSDVKRALLQRHLWAVFDATTPHRNPQFRNVVRSHSANRAEAQKKLATLIRRLALTKAQILALPDTRAATVKSAGFPQRHDPKDPFKPFLPADLYAKESSWVCLGKVSRPVPAVHHSGTNQWRSAFLPFMRAPGGRKETLKCIERHNNKKVFPVGTQFALITQTFLISDEGEMILSPLISEIQLRAYVIVNLSAREARPKATQCMAEFVMQPRQLMQGKAVMKAVKPKERRFEPPTGNPKADPFETGYIAKTPRLTTCIGCHNAAGRSGLGLIGRHSLKEANPVEIGRATSARKRDDYTWKTLRGLWRADVKQKDADPATDAAPKTTAAEQPATKTDPTRLVARFSSMTNHRDDQAGRLGTIGATHISLCVGSRLILPSRKTGSHQFLRPGTIIGWP
jgi:hypothetical protein